MVGMKDVKLNGDNIIRENGKVHGFLPGQFFIMGWWWSYFHPWLFTLFILDALITFLEY